MLTVLKENQTKPSTDIQLKDNHSVEAQLTDLLTAGQEHVVVFTMDTRLNMIDVHTVTIGTVNASLIHPREIFKLAIMDNAATIILAHNHPSGNPLPSEADKQVTKTVAEAGRVMGIELVDHVIVSTNGSYSMRVDLNYLFN